MLCRIRHKITLSEFPVAFERKKCYSIARRQKAVADIAQSVERILGKDEVPSSNLGISSRKSHELLVHDFFWCAGHALTLAGERPVAGIRRQA